MVKTNVKIFQNLKKYTKLSDHLCINYVIVYINHIYKYIYIVTQYIKLEKNIFSL